MGRTVNKDGDLVEAHREHRVVQSAHWNLNFPWFHKNQPTQGPKSVYLPPNYKPIPNDQRINDMLAEMQKAKEDLQAATAQVKQRLAADNPLLAQIAQQQQQEKEDLRQKLNAALGLNQESQPSSPSVPGPQSPAAKAGEAAANSSDSPLATWKPEKGK
jgi:hypothetical protein